MKKRIVIGATLVALVLSVGLFAISVFAAVTQTFGVNNRIIFVGSDLLEFTLNAEITGTTKDGEDFLKESWSYNTETSTETSMTWNIEESLVFNEEGKVLDPTAENKISIVYTFNITNAQNSDKRIKAYITPSSYDNEFLNINITGAVGSEIIIDKGASRQLKLEIVPKVKFFESKACNFSLMLDPID